MNDSILIFATITTGLTAGLFYAWAFSVTIGLSKVNDINYIAAMQSINKEILNLPFFLIFMGSTISLPLAAFLNFESSISPYMLIASVIYLIGCIGVTFFGNVPLNNTLEKFQLNSASADEVQFQRSAFENKWNRLNMIRTLSSTIAFIILIIAIMD